MDVWADDDDDTSVLDQLCLANELSTPDPPSALDQLIKANECSEPDVTTTTTNAWEKMIETMLEESESLTPLLDKAAPPEMVQQVYREMDTVDDGGWHNQEYAMEETERRLQQLMDAEKI